MPYAAGGGNDAMARIVAEKMSKTLGQQIVIENRGGAGGSIATRAVAKAAPDGYTLVLGGTGTLAINPTLYGNVGYDPRKDFAPVGLIGTSALIVLVHPSLPAQSIKDLIALAKAAARQAQLRVRRQRQRHPSRAPSCSQLMAGIKLTHIPYKGSGPALTDLVGGHVQHLFQLAAAGAVGLVEGGQGARARGHRREALARCSPMCRRWRNRAAGLRGGAALRHRRAGRHAAPDHRQAQRGAARGGRVARHQERMAADGTEPLVSTPEEYAADIDREETKWSKIVKESGAKVE